MKANRMLVMSMVCAAACVAPVDAQTLVRSEATPAQAQTPEAAYDVLFAGIKLGARQQSQARALLTLLHQQQVDQDAAFMEKMTAERTKMTALQTKRDAELRALLATDADRTLFDGRTTASMGGGGGRGGRVIVGGGAGTADAVIVQGSGARGGGEMRAITATDANGAVSTFVVRGDSAVVTRRGDAAVAVAGAGGGRVVTMSRGDGTAAAGAIMAVGTPASPQMIEDMQYRRLFDGITLDAAAEVRARQLITVHESLRAPMTRPPVQLRVNANAGKVSVQQDTQESLLSLVTTAADRETLSSRIVVIK